MVISFDMIIIINNNNNSNANNGCRFLGTSTVLAKLSWCWFFFPTQPSVLEVLLILKDRSV